MVAKKGNDLEITDDLNYGKPEEEIDIMDDIDINSVKASLDAGVILPRLKPRLNSVYEVEVVSTIKTFESDYGKTYTIDVRHESMLMNLILPKSFRFQLIVTMLRNNLVDSKNQPDFKKLIGKTIAFQKTIGNTKQYKNVELYSCQIK